VSISEPEVENERARLEREVLQLEALVEARRAWGREVSALLAELRRARARLREDDAPEQVARVLVTAVGYALVIAGAFSLEPSFGAVMTVAAFGGLVWEAVR
jgi:predicted membrane chloride channel (bestrophin family)